VWACAIFGFSSLENIPAIKFPISPDKIAHVGIFFILTLLCWRAFHHQTSIRWLKNRAVLIAFIVATIYGFSDEFHQRFVPGRSYDLYDFLADSLGAYLFVLGHWLFYRRKGETAPRELV
jgi:VanZ family protein